MGFFDVLAKAKVKEFKEMGEIVSFEDAKLFVRLESFHGVVNMLIICKWEVVDIASIVRAPVEFIEKCKQAYYSKVELSSEEWKEFAYSGKFTFGI
jgi:hypothetical protein